MNNHQYNIIICEIFNKYLHGLTLHDDPSLESHYLVIRKFAPREIFYSIYDNDEDNSDNDEQDQDENVTKLEIYIQLYRHRYQQIVRNALFMNKNHSYIRNYHQMIKKPDYIRAEIAKCILLNTGECIAVLKTHWLRLIQRTWKRIVKERKKIVIYRQQPNHLYYRQIYGQWSKKCRNYPILKGMLSYLTK